MWSVSGREFTRLVVRSVDQSFLPWVVEFCLYFRWPLHNLTWRREKCRRMVRQMWNILSEIIMRSISAMSRAWGVRAFFFRVFKNNLQSIFVVLMKWTQEKCGFSYDDNWGINNIEKNDKREAHISILVEKINKERKHRTGKKKRNKIGVVALPS